MIFIFSALMKLTDYHSCDSFVERRAGVGEKTSIQLSMADLGIARECTERSLQIMKETMMRIVTFVNVITHHRSQSQNEPLSPLILHCIYRATCALEWMGDEVSGCTGSPEEAARFRDGRRMCETMLREMQWRWRGAG
jgi:hypothetical protein